MAAATLRLPTNPSSLRVDTPYYGYMQFAGEWETVDFVRRETGLYWKRPTKSRWNLLCQTEHFQSVTIQLIRSRREPDREPVQRLLDRGHSHQKIADILGVTVHAVRKCTGRWGLIRDVLYRVNEPALRQLIDQGCVIKEVAAIIGVDPKAVVKKASRLGIVDQLRQNGRERMRQAGLKLTQHWKKA